MPMALYRRSSVFADLLRIACKLPWAVSLGLAALSLMTLHVLALAFTSAIHALAFFSQFMVPPAFLIGATLSYFNRSRKTRPSRDARSGKGPAVAALTRQQFASLVAEGFRCCGFQVMEPGGAIPAGVDLVLTRGRERFLVQCTQWRARQVSATIVRELYGVMAAEQAVGGYVVTSGRFTRDALAFAAGRNIELIDGSALPTLLREPTTATVTTDDAPATPAGA